MGITKPQKFLNQLSNYEVWGLDTCLFIYHLEGHPHYQTLTTPIFSRVEKGHVRGVISTLVILELLVKPYQQGDLSATQEYHFLLSTFPHLFIQPLDLEVADKAAEIRATHRLPVADSIHIATALNFPNAAFVTNDKAHRSISETIDIYVLDEWLS